MLAIPLLLALLAALAVLHYTGFWRAFPLMLLLGGVAYIAYDCVGQEHGHAQALFAACTVPAAIVALPLWRPAASKFSLWVVDGVIGAAVCAKWVGLGAIVLTLGLTRMNVFLWARHLWWVGAVALAGWGLEKLLHRHVGASIRRELGSPARVRWLVDLHER